MPDQNSVELRWIIAVIRRWFWLIIACTLLAAGITYAVTSWSTPVYDASVTMLVELSEDAKSNNYNDLVAGERLAITYVQMLTERPILENVISKLGLKMAPEVLLKKITVDTVKDTQLIRLTVKDASPYQAALIADTLAEAFTTRIQELQAVRFTPTLTGMLEKINAKTILIDQIQAKIDVLTAKSAENGAELSRLESLLEGYRTDYRAVQNSFQALQLTVDRSTDRIHTVESAQIGKGVLSPYSATVTMLIDQSMISGGSGAANTSSERIALTYGPMMTSTSVMEAVIAKLNLGMKPDELARNINVTPVRDTQLVRLSVEDVDPGRAKLLADTTSEIYIGQIRTLLARPYTDRLAELQQQMDNLAAQIEKIQDEMKTVSSAKTQAVAGLAPLQTLLIRYRDDNQALQDDFEQLRLNAAKASDAVVVAESAHPPEQPVQHRDLYMAVAAVIGLLLGASAAFLFEQLNNRISTSQDVNMLLGLNTLGLIGQMERGTDELVSINQPTSYTAESFRVLGNNIRLSSVNPPLKIILVTSPTPSEGKSVVSANLGVVLAKAGLKVVVIDADLRLPRLHQVFGLKMEDGLTDCLSTGNVNGRLQSTELDNLKVLTSGQRPSNPAEVISSSNLSRLLTELSKKVDVVVIDSAPILVTADTAILASQADGVLLVLRSGHSMGQAAHEAVNRLRQVKANLSGVVLNAVPVHRDSNYRYYGSKSNNPVRFYEQLQDRLVSLSQQVKKYWRQAQKIALPHHQKE